MVQLSIQRDANTSIHQQLVTQLSLQIASGTLSEGDRLPSIRGLSRQIGIHYNTCLSVYKELAALGLIDLKRGSGAIVKQNAIQTSKAGLSGKALHDMAQTYVKMALERGYNWDEISGAVEWAWQTAKEQSLQQRLVFVDRHQDILPVFQAELEAGLKRPVHVSSIENVRLKEDTLQRTCFFISRYHIEGFKQHLLQLGIKPKAFQDQVNVCLLDVSGATPEIERVKQLPQGAMLLVISASTIILQIAESMITGIRGQDVLVSARLLGEETPNALLRQMQRADLVIQDVLVEKKLAYEGPNVITTRLLPDSEFEKIRNHMV